MRDINWRPMKDAPTDGTSFLVFIPHMAHDLMTRGVYTMHRSGWGGGVWETGNGWRPFDDEVKNAVWTDLKLVAMSGEQAHSELTPPS